MKVGVMGERGELEHDGGVPLATYRSPPDEIRTLLVLLSLS